MNKSNEQKNNSAKVKALLLEEVLCDAEKTKRRLSHQLTSLGLRKSSDMTPEMLELCINWENNTSGAGIKYKICILVNQCCFQARERGRETCPTL